MFWCGHFGFLVCKFFEEYPENCVHFLKVCILLFTALVLMFTIAVQNYQNPSFHYLLQIPKHWIRMRLVNVGILAGSLSLLLPPFRFPTLNTKPSLLKLLPILSTNTLQL